MEYGWTFFIIALDGHAKREKASTLRSAIAVRVGSHADKKEWKKFTKKMTPKD